MTKLLNLITPLILVSVIIYSITKRVDIFSTMKEGALNGLKLLVQILPNILVLFPCVYMLRASGFTEALSHFLAPFFAFIGIPSQTTALMILRPFSGSGALAIGSDIMKTCGVDSLVGRTAAVMLGSTETTFYVVAVYFGAAGIKDSRHAIPCALIADFSSFFFSALFVKLFFG